MKMKQFNNKLTNNLLFFYSFNKQAALEAHRALGAEKALIVESIDETVVRRMALYARAELPGLATFVGGVIAQEIVKRFGKFTPIRQFMHHDYFELVPEQGVRADCAVSGSRYDSQIAIIGRAAHEKLVSQKWFMVGCGALGCEYLKVYFLTFIFFILFCLFLLEIKNSEKRRRWNFGMIAR